MTDKLITDLTAISGALADNTATEVMRSGQTVSEQALGSDWKTYIKSWIAKADVGLGNVDNTSDATKNAASVTLTNKALTSPAISTPTGIVKGDVGLGNVLNSAQLVAASNLSDLADAPTARNNLGLTPLQDPFFTDTTTYLSAPAFGASISGGTMFANTLYMVPVWVSRTRTFSQYALAVTALAASASIRIGLYNSSGNQPTTKIDEATTPIDATVATGVTGLKTSAFAVNASLKPGLYFIALACGASPSVVKMSTPAAFGALGTFFFSTGVVANTGLSRAFTFAALPADETAQTYVPSGNGGASMPYPGIR